MKNLHLYKKVFVGIIFFPSVFCFVLFFQSCTHKPESEAIPSISFYAGDTYIYKDSIIESGNNLKIKLFAENNSLTGNELSKIVITCFTDGSGVVLLDSNIAVKSFAYELDILPELQSGTKKYVFRLIDESGKINERSLNIEFFSLNPFISFIAGSDYASGNFTTQQNKFFRVGINASSSSYTGGKLKQIIIKRKYGSLFITEIDSTLNELSNFSGDWYFTSNELATSEEWWFLIKDEFDRVGFISFIIVTNAPQTPMSQYFSESIYNGLSENNYGWDLLNDNEVFWTSSETVKDMVNDTNYVHLLEPFFFKIMMKSENSTRFVQANYFDFENAPYEDAVDIFTGATISNVRTYMSNFSEEDVFIAKLRNQEKYVAIKISNIEQTTEDNLDRIDFEYKKLPE